MSDSVNIGVVDFVDVVALREASESLVERWELRKVMSDDPSRREQCEILRCIR